MLCCHKTTNHIGNSRIFLRSKNWKADWEDWADLHGYFNNNKTNNFQLIINIFGFNLLI